MTINTPTPAQIPQLRLLWKQVFGDSDAFLDQFFSLGFSYDRARCVSIEGQPVSALYWFDCLWEGKKLAYLYAVATDTAFRKQGYFQALIRDTHRHLQQLGYAGAVLSPAGEALFRMYEKMGYETFCSIREFCCDAGDTPFPVTMLSPEDYASLRRQYLPAGGILQEGTTLTFWASQALFYAGDGVIFTGYRENDTLRVSELLGDASAAPGILKALNLKKGTFRTPGSDTPFAMCCLFSPAKRLPSYLGLALD